MLHRGGNAPRWSTLIFSYTRRLGPYFLVQIFLISIFLGFRKKMTIFGGHFYAFRGIFLPSRYRMGIFFFFFFWGGGGLLKYKNLWGTPIISDILVDAGSKPTYKEKNRAHPLPHPHLGYAHDLCLALILYSQMVSHFCCLFAHLTCLRCKNFTLLSN